MARMTSAYANKVLRKLNEDKDFYLEKEADGRLYVAALDEEPMIPEYDYAEVSACIAQIDQKIVKIKHAVNLVNVTNTVDVEGVPMTIDTILVSMAQLNRRKTTLDFMRKRPPKSRINSGVIARKTAPEYQYINYDLDLVKKEYEEIDAKIAAMQIALDRFNQTYEFEVDI